MNTNLNYAIPKENFDLDRMRDLYQNGMKKSNFDCKEYIAQYFYPTTAGTHVFIEDMKPSIFKMKPCQKFTYSDLKRILLNGIKRKLHQKN